MTEEMTLGKATEAYNLGLDDGEKIGYAWGKEESRKELSRAYTLVSCLCIIVAALFILWVYTV